MNDPGSNMSRDRVSYIALGLSVAAFVIAVLVAYVTLIEPIEQEERQALPPGVLSPAVVIVPTIAPTPTLSPGIAPTLVATQTPIPRGTGLSLPEINAVLALEGWAEEDIPIARCIAWHESNWHVQAHSLTDPGSGSYGLFQINSWWSTGADPSWDKGQDPELGRFNIKRAFEPFYNARYALNIFRASGWSPWSTAHLCGV